jgi:hypothetical protein
MGFQLDFATGALVGDINDLWPGTGGIVRGVLSYVSSCPVCAERRYARHRRRRTYSCVRTGFTI